MESNNNKNIETIKFLCNYGEKILPRYTDGTLRYASDLTCVLTVDRSISFTECCHTNDLQSKYTIGSRLCHFNPYKLSYMNLCPL
nr:hypothetical protein CFP56_48089 [Quercus suber]